jgi:PAS domain S-box-containing protein
MPDERRPSASSEKRGVVGFGGDYYRLLFDHAGVSMVGTDARFDIRSWNVAASRMFGADARRMVGTSLLTVIPQEGREEAERALHAAVDDGITNQFEFCHRDAQGGPRQIAVTVSPIPNRAGARVGALACFRDITRRIQLAEEVAQHRKMASLGEMAGALAHHFNNILGGIVTSVDFALAASDPGVRYRVLQNAAQALTRATRLVDSLLAFAEGDRRYDDVADLFETVVRIADRTESELAEQGIKLQRELASVPAMDVPRKQLETVLLNLLHNAEEAMPDGGTVTLGLEPADQGVRLLVSDTGCGIPDEELSRIFEPFYSRPHPEHRARRLREGLGLAVVHGIVQDLGATITVQSEPDHGTTFCIRVPRTVSKTEG